MLRYELVRCSFVGVLACGEALPQEKGVRRADRPYRLNPTLKAAPKLPTLWESRHLAVLSSVSISVDSILSTDDRDAESRDSSCDRSNSNPFCFA